MTNPRPSLVDPYVGNVDVWLREDPYYSAMWIYDHLKPLGYLGGYEVVKRLVRRLKPNLHKVAYLRFETEPGKQAQVDFGEFVVAFPDGRIRRYYCFAMILGYSRMLYCELVERCDLSTFLDCHIHAFEWFGGVPQEVLYDRMRNVFIRRIAGKTEFNRMLVSLALHYGFKPDVTPPYAPWVKGKVERPYSFVREGFWRGYPFTCLERANQDLLRWLREKAERIHGTTHERVTERFERERPRLGWLPENRFDTSYPILRTVRKDCLVPFDGNLYRVPHTMVERPIMLRAKDATLRIYYDDQMLVTYTIPADKGQLVEDPQFKEALRKDREMNRRKYGSHGRGKGRACPATISPTIPSYALPVEVRSMDAYSFIGGEVGHE